MFEISNARNTSDALDVATAGKGFAGSFTGENALLIAGGLRIPQGAQPNFVLTTDAHGNAIWAAGQTGATGATGAKGATGATGAKMARRVPAVPPEQGQPGATGPTGATGAIGPTGGTGATGATGARHDGSRGSHRCYGINRRGWSDWRARCSGRDRRARTLKARKGFKAPKGLKAPRVSKA